MLGADLQELHQSATVVLVTILKFQVFSLFFGTRAKHKQVE